MSARSNPACAILPSGRLVVIGGERELPTPFRLDTCLTFTIKHSCAAAKISKFLASGKDIQSFAGIARVSGGTNAGVTHDTTARLRSFLEASRKAVAFFTQHHELLARGLLMREEYEKVDSEELVAMEPALHCLFKRLFGTGLTYASESETVSSLCKSWEHGGPPTRSPLDMCPRWLAFPCEALVNLRSKQPSKAAKGVTHMIKCFGTMKDDIGCVLEKDAVPNADAGLHVKWARTSSADMQSNLGSQGSERDVQVLLMATVGRMYACQLITFHPTANKAAKEQELDLLRVPLITAMLQMTLDGTPLDCARCGTTEVLRYKQRYANRLKVNSLHCSSRLRLRRAVIECPEYVGIPY
ncbi:g1660 [Coccomyxa elongata]